MQVHEQPEVAAESLDHHKHAGVQRLHRGQPVALAIDADVHEEHRRAPVNVEQRESAEEGQRHEGHDLAKVPGRGLPAAHLAADVLTRALKFPL